MRNLPLSCPVCHTLEGYCEGEYVDVGVGNVQCSPDYCQQCGYIQPGGNFDEGTMLDTEQYRKCWELQTPPKGQEDKQ